MAIHIKEKNKGKLHKALGVPKGKKIPASKLKKKSTDSPSMVKMKTFAKNARKWKHPDGGMVGDPNIYNTPYGQIREPILTESKNKPLRNFYRDNVPETYRSWVPGFSDIEDAAYLRDQFSKEGTWGGRALAVGAMALPVVGSKALRKIDLDAIGKRSKQLALPQQSTRPFPTVDPSVHPDTYYRGMVGEQGSFDPAEFARGALDITEKPAVGVGKTIGDNAIVPNRFVSSSKEGARVYGDPSIWGSGNFAKPNSMQQGVMMQYKTSRAPVAVKTSIADEFIKKELGRDFSPEEAAAVLRKHNVDAVQDDIFYNDNTDNKAFQFINETILNLDKAHKRTLSQSPHGKGYPSILSKRIFQDGGEIRAQQNDMKKYAKGGKVPEYSLGGILAEGAMGAGTGALMGAPAGGPIGAGAGAIIGGAVGLTKGIIGHVGDKRAEEAAALANQMPGISGASIQNQYAPTFACGGKVRKYPGGGETLAGTAELEAGEIYMTPDGDIQHITDEAPKHGEKAKSGNTGVRLDLPEGTKILSNRERDPMTGLPFTDTYGKDTYKMRDKFVKHLKDAKTKYAKESAVRNLGNLAKKFNAAYDVQEQQKFAKGGMTGQPNQYQDGGKKVSSTYGGYMIPGVTAYPDIDSLEGWQQQPFGFDRTSMQGFYGMGQAGKLPMHNYADSTYRDFPEVNSESWQQKPFNPSNTDVGVFPYRDYGINNLSEYGREPAQEMENWMSDPSMRGPVARDGSNNWLQQGVSGIRHFFDPNRLPQSQGPGTGQPGRGSMGIPESQRNTSTPTATQQTTNSRTAITPLDTTPRTITGADMPSSTRQAALGNINTPEISMAGAGVTGNAGMTPTGAGRNIFQKAGNAVGGASGALGIAGQLAPVAYNLIQGLRKPEELNPKQFENPYAKRAMDLMANRRVNVDPMLEANRNAAAIGRYNLASSGAGAGQQFAGAQGFAANRMRADQEVEAYRQNMNNQYASQEAQMMAGLGSEEAQNRFRTADYNLANQAAGRSFGGSAASQLGQFTQVQQQMANQKERDAQLLNILKANPWAMKWLGMQGPTGETI